ncbi:exonuclease [uncultured Caudovirales phage]|uniref:Exonuclease n=1 Tax=uncultured Caudovirales phage TaxID=2100421 RepID=A0A6J5SEZ0_9CAUD|nr:exonuclease [uncultured Caudovirales phage]CAB5228137.1 exonuclease [uncultured Caudovirales phage]
MYRIIFDADGIVYRVGFALEGVDSPHVVKRNVIEYIEEVSGKLEKVFIKVTKPTIVISAPGRSNFRFDLAKTKPYKGNRTSPKPKHYDLIRKLLLEMDNSMMIEGQEADDTVADLTAENPNKTVVVSQDKDLLQNPGWYYIPGEKRPIFFVDPETTGMLLLEKGTGNKPTLFGTGYKWLMAQMLLGDTADNIPGLTGYGAMKVYNLLKNKHTKLELQQAVLEAYALKKASDRHQEVLELLTIGGHIK